MMFLKESILIKQMHQKNVIFGVSTRRKRCIIKIKNIIKNSPQYKKWVKKLKRL